MATSHCEIYIHLVWTTLECHPYLVGELREAILRCIHAECAGLKAEVIALNSMEDHVHLLVRLPSSVTVAVLAKQSKGSSSHLARQGLGHGEFQWCEGYGAFSISRWDMSNVTGYIRNQQEHHRINTAKAALEPE